MNQRKKPNSFYIKANKNLAEKVSRIIAEKIPGKFEVFEMPKEFQDEYTERTTSFYNYETPSFNPKKFKPFWINVYTNLYFNEADGKSVWTVRITLLGNIRVTQRRWEEGEIIHKYCSGFSGAECLKDFNRGLKEYLERVKELTEGK